jgi:hypothetical protein
MGQIRITRPGVIRLSGKPKPKPKPAPKRKRKPAAPKPPPAPPRRLRPVVEPLTTSRFCICDKPMVIRDQDMGRWSEAIEPRCQRCGKPRRVNAPVNNPQSVLPPDAA